LLPGSRRMSPGSASIRPGHEKKCLDLTFSAGYKSKVSRSGTRLRCRIVIRHYGDYGLSHVNSSGMATLVKQAVDIVDVVGQVVQLRRSGNRHLGLCPFHQEKTPSFHVDAENQLYYCFGCGSGGDVLNFVMKHRNVAFGEAIRYLAERYHIALPELDHVEGATPGAIESARKEREELYRILRSAADFFYDRLHHSPEGRIAREYIARRGLPAEVVETERMGYAPQSWDSLSRHLANLGYDVEPGIGAGLLARSTGKDRVYDRFRNRLIFPIRDEGGRIVAFGGRSLSADLKDEPKYLNSPETAVYHKGRLLYQLARAREACRQVRQTVLVEGYMDLLAFHARGFFRVVATLGTALTPHQVRILSRMSDEVVMAYDGDEAGDKAMLRGLPLFLQENVAVSCVRFPDGMDPDDFLKRDGLEGFEKLLRSRQELGAYAVKRILDGWDGSASARLKIAAELRPIFDAVRQPLLKSEYLRLAADRLCVSEEVLNQQLRHDRRTPERPYFRSSRPPVLPGISETQTLEEKILRLLIRYPELIEQADSSGALEYFREPKLRALAMVLVGTPHAPEGEFNASIVYDELADSESKEMFTRFMLESTELAEPRVQLNDWLIALTRRELKQRSLDLDTALKAAVREGDSDRVRHILVEIQNLNSAKKRDKDLPYNL